jgi:hypothetical protein
MGGLLTFSGSQQVKTDALSELRDNKGFGHEIDGSGFQGQAARLRVISTEHKSTGTCARSG